MNLSADELSERGGWLIEDPRSRHEESPDTFWLPDDTRRAAIAAGSRVKLLLWFVDDAGDGVLVPQCERMWALVEARRGDVIRGRLTSPPASSHAPLEMGEPIEFRPTDTIDVLDAEDDWEEHRAFLQAMYEGDEAFERWNPPQGSPSFVRRQPDDDGP